MNLTHYRNIGRAFTAGFLAMLFLLALGAANARADNGPFHNPCAPMPRPAPGAVVAGEPFNTWSLGEVRRMAE